MLMKKLKIVIKLIIIQIFYINLYAAPAENAKILLVGTKESPPFAMKNSEGKWEGISIELWDLIAKKLNLKYKFVQKDLEGLINGVSDKKLDAAVAALTITPEREKNMDFSHSYYITALSIAVKKEKNSYWNLIKKVFFSWNTLIVIVFLAASIIFIGSLIWLTEHKKNPDSFDPNPLKGIANAIWWAAATVTFVGDKHISIKTGWGKTVAVLWMVVSFVFLASVIASITLVFYGNTFNKKIALKDLTKEKISTVKCSTSDIYLKERKFYADEYGTIKEALNAVALGKADAMVYDKPLLQHYINRYYPEDIVLIDSSFSPQDYSIALQQGSPLLEKINQALLEITHSPKWDKILHKYLGNGEGRKQL